MCVAPRSECDVSRSLPIAPLAQLFQIIFDESQFQTIVDGVCVENVYKNKISFVFV